MTAALMTSGPVVAGARAVDGADAAASEWRLGGGDAITPELTAMRLLGGGSAYEAYLAFDDVTALPVVVKIVRPDQVSDVETLYGLEREAMALTVANHPVVVRHLRHDLDGERPHLVLECVDGPRLSSLVRRHGRLAPQQYLALGIDVAAALHFFRQVDVCHLDIKPSNIIMGAPARLIDLSVARNSANAADLRSPIGTDAYMAPEQAVAGTSTSTVGAVGASAGVPGFASDVWGLGATLFHAVAGYRPFDDGDRDATHLEDRFPQVLDEPRALPDDVPAPVVDVVRAMLAPRPEERPEPREVAAALEPVLAAQPRAKLSFKAR
ncbi:serine/threonine-protein kinase [Nocardioides sp. R-C-SC26]|uniref:serine/threonine-protein kinase n=1 Tax=Nocardioides sp. R-C-SC26 TaxID=2870414 RepID=UPI001E643C4B|nr:serine/threonine-protein kinase [Nocardioides sp. R-C-SC26]